MELAVLIGQDIRIRYEVKAGFAVLLLHSHHVGTQLVLPGDLMAGREVVDLLEFVESLVEVLLAVRVAPQEVPFVGLSVGEAVGLKN